MIETGALSGDVDTPPFSFEEYLFEAAADLTQRMARLEQYSDEWTRLHQQRQQILQHVCFLDPQPVSASSSPHEITADMPIWSLARDLFDELAATGVHFRHWQLIDEVMAPLAVALAYPPSPAGLPALLYVRPDPDPRRLVTTLRHVQRMLERDLAGDLGAFQSWDGLAERRMGIVYCAAGCNTTL